MDDVKLVLRGLVASDIKGVDASHYPSPDVTAACQQVEIKLVAKSCQCGDDDHAVSPGYGSDIDGVLGAAKQVAGAFGVVYEHSEHGAQYIVDTACGIQSCAQSDVLVAAGGVPHVPQRSREVLTVAEGGCLEQRSGVCVQVFREIVHKLTVCF